MDLIEIFNRTMRLCDSDGSLQSAVKASILNQSVTFEADPVPDTTSRFSEPAKRVLSSKRSFEAAKPYADAGKRVCVLNFASFVTPGGGVLRGSKAQEESLCRISTLYPALISDTAAPFYQSHHDDIDAGVSTRKNNDDCIYTPDVRVICEDTYDCDLMPNDKWYNVDVITCAAPDQRYAGEWTFRPNDAELFEVMNKRICRIFAIAALRQADVLIMGAFGCGVFGNSPVVVARAFEAAIEKYQYHFETIEFGIANAHGDSPNYNAFRNISGIIASEPNESKTQSLVSAELPDYLLTIDTGKVNHTMAVLYSQGSWLRDNDDERISFEELGLRSEKFAGGSGGICAYKVYKYAMSYIAPQTQALRYRYVAAAILVIGNGYLHKHSDVKLTEKYDELLQRHLSHLVVGNEYFMSCGPYSEEEIESVRQLYIQTGALQLLTILKVLKALEWDDIRGNNLIRQIEDNRFV